jgi:hypothetical protein
MMSFEAFLQAVASPDLRAIAEHWHAARAGRRMPAWGDIDPVAIGRRLRLVWAWKYERETDSFLGRLAGEEIDRAFGKSQRGMKMAEFFAPEAYQEFLPWHLRVIDEPAFLHGAGKVYSRVDRNFSGERIMLPLAEDGERGDGILGATVYEPAAPAPVRDLCAADFEKETIAFYALDDGAISSTS